uniref:Uncharacterized protein n=1 Tax=Chromera velia CCMP2878 TaxID=1169474 RepID=A0A0G4G7J2_9ALVE|eukprot:Cvel_20612.t1-p1 / transcript=Cvel_20612.t1 / gene=Cvel_20612 / organism=Chromera_velia_CCMP2878 / gene_product=hypothetical protein / transcript_product=hypothetical protein / location=Cvel_scaffold1865:16566-28392(+) / protein_length=1220 / sequence_SO=supercontig / SO=protein_coding / is_pseudo=false
MRTCRKGGLRDKQTMHISIRDSEVHGETLVLFISVPHKGMRKSNEDEKETDRHSHLWTSLQLQFERGLSTAPTAVRMRTKDLQSRNRDPELLEMIELAKPNNQTLKYAPLPKTPQASQYHFWRAISGGKDKVLVVTDKENGLEVLRVKQSPPQAPKEKEGLSAWLTDTLKPWASSPSSSPPLEVQFGDLHPSIVKRTFNSVEYADGLRAKPNFDLAAFEEWQGVSVFKSNPSSPPSPGGNGPKECYRLVFYRYYDLSSGSSEYLSFSDCGSTTGALVWEQNPAFVLSQNQTLFQDMHGFHRFLVLKDTSKGDTVVLLPEKKAVFPSNDEPRRGKDPPFREEKKVAVHAVAAGRVVGPARIGLFPADRKQRLISAYHMLKLGRYDAALNFLLEISNLEKFSEDEGRLASLIFSDKDSVPKGLAIKFLTFLIAYQSRFSHNDRSVFKLCQMGRGAMKAVYAKYLDVHKNLPHRFRLVVSSRAPEDETERDDLMMLFLSPIQELELIDFLGDDDFLHSRRRALWHYLHLPHMAPNRVLSVGKQSVKKLQTKPVSIKTQEMLKEVRAILKGSQEEVMYLYRNVWAFDESWTGEAISGQEFAQKAAVLGALFVRKLGDSVNVDGQVLKQINKFNSFLDKKMSSSTVRIPDEDEELHLHWPLAVQVRDYTRERAPGELPEASEEETLSQYNKVSNPTRSYSRKGGHDLVLPRLSKRELENLRKADDDLVALYAKCFKQGTVSGASGPDTSALLVNSDDDFILMNSKKVAEETESGSKRLEKETAENTFTFLHQSCNRKMLESSLMEQRSSVEDAIRRNEQQLQDDWEVGTMDEHAMAVDVFGLEDEKVDWRGLLPFFLKQSRRVWRARLRHVHINAVSTAVILVFEYAANLRLREDQALDMKRLLPSHGASDSTDTEWEIESDSATPTKPSEPVLMIIQRLMGGGKTFVLGTLLATCKADGFHLSVLVTPQVSQKHYVVVPPATAHTIQNTFVEILHELAHFQFPDAADHSEAAEKKVKTLEASLQHRREVVIELAAILRLFRERGSGVFDEIDVTFDPKTEHNFPLSHKSRPQTEMLDLIVHLYTEAGTDPAIKDLIGVRRRSQVENFELYFNDRVQPALIEAAAKFMVTNTKWEVINRACMTYLVGGLSADQTRQWVIGLQKQLVREEEKMTGGKDIPPAEYEEIRKNLDTQVLFREIVGEADTDLHDLIKLDVYDDEVIERLR